MGSDCLIKLAAFPCCHLHCKISI